jgi:uridine phosphorylase
VFGEMPLKDYSITSPEVLIEAKARFSELSLDDCAVPKIIVVAMGSELQKLAELTGASEVDWVFSTMYMTKIKGSDIGMIPLSNASMAPRMAFMMENLIACGAEIVLLSGALGAFQSNMKIGDFVIPSEAVIGEGTSKYYFPKKKVIKTDPEIVKTLQEACKIIGAKPFVGPVWTTDAFFREMRSIVGKLQSQGVYGVEMETSAMCTVAKFKGIKAGSLLTVSDHLASFKWEQHFWSEKYRKIALETSPKIIIEALKLLAKI